MGRWYIFVLTATVAITATPIGPNLSPISPLKEPCDIPEDLLKDYQTSLNKFVLEVFKRTAEQKSFHLVTSATSVYATLGAIAEGTDPETQRQLFKLLSLPKDPCRRLKYYQYATSLILPDDDIKVSNTRNLILDKEVFISVPWYNYVSKFNLLDLTSASIKENPEAALSEMRETIHAELPELNLDGNSVLLESLDFSGIWTTAFPDAEVERSPFYAVDGQKTGYVDLMRMRTLVRMGYSEKLQAKVLQLPLGEDGRYSIMYGIVISDQHPLSIVNELTGTIIPEVFESLQDSAIPLEIALPRFTMTSEVNVRDILDGLGIHSLWSNPNATRFSSPPALPSSYIQRVTVSIDTKGVNPAQIVPVPPSDADTGLDPMVGRDFIANVPFLYGIFDKKTHSCIVAAAFSQPTYPL